MKDMLLAIDTSEDRAVAQAETVVDLCETADVRAHLLHVFVDNPEGASVTQVRAVRRAAEILEDAGIEVEYHEEAGDPAEEIIIVADRIDADYICIAGRKRSPAGKLVFGSVMQDVILNTDRAVISCSTAEAFGD